MSYLNRTSPKLPQPERWLWIKLEVARQEELRHGLNIVRLFADDQTPAYFCHYSLPRPRLEIKVLTSASWPQLRRKLLALCKNRNLVPRRLYVEKTDPNFLGSEPHALARLVIHELNSKGQLGNASVLTDVVHWMYNMAGFSYPQEIAAHLRSAHALLLNVTPIPETPVNSTYAASLPQPARPVR